MSGMLSLLLHAVARGRVTIKYPYERLEPPEGFRGRPIIDFEKCVGCGGCVNACPSNALTLEENGDVRIIRLNYARCIFCGRCEENCPEGAIKLSRDFELASPDKQDLVVEIEFTLKKCERCGRVYATEAQVESVRSKLKDMLEELGEDYLKILNLCPECRRLVAIMRLSEAYKRRWEAYERRART